jgi:SAM-dependent methyltransferase
LEVAEVATPESMRSLETRDRIRRNFDRAAVEYAQFEARRVFFRDLLAELLSGERELQGARVLDVGCGTGASTEFLLETVGTGGSVLGLDASLGMLREARRRLHGRATFIQMDGCRFSKGLRGAFGAVVYNAVLFMLPDAPGSLACARDVLKSRGAVYISWLEGAFVGPEREPLPQIVRRKGFSPGRHALSPWPGILQVLEELFEGIRVRQFPVRLAPEDFSLFYGMEPMSAGLLPALAYPDRRRIVEEFAKEWCAEGKFVEQVWYLASARKPEQ